MNPVGVKNNPTWVLWLREYLWESHESIIRIQKGCLKTQEGVMRNPWECQDREQEVQVPRSRKESTVSLATTSLHCTIPYIDRISLCHELPPRSPLPTNTHYPSPGCSVDEMTLRSQLCGELRLVIPHELIVHHHHKGLSQGEPLHDAPCTCCSMSRYITLTQCHQWEEGGRN